ncbi:unnamed protein product [Anisakis simplex]|uniref:Serine/threonine-protein kinase (inferred by orthology to a C. elegans protein) n=1 Tax=Anisakis simplex TaxID=6269 RepID=A0A0M3J1N6_ANISI|nr:unnamed protein product [Anisakis simplex]
MWISCRPPRRWILSLIQLTKHLLRDRTLEDSFHAWKLQEGFVQILTFVSQSYLNNEGTAEWSTSTKALLSIAQKLSSGTVENAEKLAAYGIQKVVIALLYAKEMTILQATLKCLGTLAEMSAIARADMSNSITVDACLQLAKDTDLLTQKLEFF